jgi:hypothetical protein
MMNQNDQDRLERSLKGKTPKSKTPDAVKLARSVIAEGPSYPTQEVIWTFLRQASLAGLVTLNFKLPEKCLDPKCGVVGKHKTKTLAKGFKVRVHEGKGYSKGRSR